MPTPEEEIQFVVHRLQTKLHSPYPHRVEFAQTGLFFIFTHDNPVAAEKLAKQVRTVHCDGCPVACETAKVIQRRQFWLQYTVEGWAKVPITAESGARCMKKFKI